MSGNGADLGLVLGLLSDVLRGQSEIRNEVREIRGDLSGQAGKLDELFGQIANLRQAVTEYHSSVIGHGILISELDARARRIEQRLNLPPAA